MPDTSHDAFSYFASDGGDYITRPERRRRLPGGGDAVEILAS